MDKRTPKNRAVILWTLALQGDINENHENGNALTTLMQRTEDHGHKWRDRKDIANVVGGLERQKRIIVMRKNHGIFCIRLADPNIKEPNPFAEKGTDLAIRETKLVSPEPKAAVLPDFIMEMSIDERLALAAEIGASVRDDYRKLKAGLIEAL